jgi:hypothetical protein
MCHGSPDCATQAERTLEEKATWGKRSAGPGASFEPADVADAAVLASEILHSILPDPRFLERPLQGAFKITRGTRCVRRLDR